MKLGLSGDERQADVRLMWSDRHSFILWDGRKQDESANVQVIS